MKTLVVLSALVTVALGRPGILAGIGAPVAAPLSYAAPVAGHLAYAAPVAAHVAYAAPLTISSQYHAQDELGQYRYGYSGGPSAKEEVRAFDGSVAGGYSYVDANGIVQSAQYVSDPVNGFRVAATNLPVAPEVPAAPILEAPRPVEDTPEVAEAKAAHAAALAEAAADTAAAPEAPVVPEAPAAPILEAPKPVEDTAEVSAAKAAHAAAVAEATVRASVAPVVSVVSPGLTYAPAVSYAALPATDVIAHLRAKAALLI